MKRLSIQPYFLCRIRMQKSGNRGTVLETVFVGLPDGQTILREYRNSTAKKVYLVLPPCHSPAAATETVTSNSARHDAVPAPVQPHVLSALQCGERKQ